MNIESKNYDSEFCGSLPLHNINLIQPYGYLMVLDWDTLSVIQVTENIEALLGVSPQKLINNTLSDFIPLSETELLKTSHLSTITDAIPVHLTIKDRQEQTRPCIAILHAKPEFLILEIEEVSSKKAFIDVFQNLKFAMAAIEQAGTVQKVCELSIRELKKFSGFDKIMMYKFDENWNGTVIAEVSNEGMEPYLGLTFPASDIPKQARDLYLKNPYRLIPSRLYTPVRLYPVRNPVSNSFLDLSDCNLRGVPSVHLEYLGNMEVMASMSTRIIVRDKLWGLISCHHRTEKMLTYEDRAVFELLSNIIFTKITSIENKEKFDFRNSLRQTRGKLLDYIYADKSFARGLLTHELSILNLLSAEGAVVIENGVLSTIGAVPKEDDIRNLILWLQNKGIERVYAESNLSDKYDHAENYIDTGSGVLVIPVDRRRGDYVIAFRPEVITTVNWGGNPDEAINFEPDGKKYHPRNSFRLWKETVVKTSRPWHTDELAIAEEIRNFIFEFSAKYIHN